MLSRAGTEVVNLVVFAARETVEVLTGTLSHAITAIPLGSRIDVLVNGNVELAVKTQRWVEESFEPSSSRPVIWSIETGDKGNAWNQHIHNIWPGVGHTIYIDGYVHISFDSVNAILATLSRDGVMGSSAIPSSGASAQTLKKMMREHGGFHGNFCAISATALEKLRCQKIFIPLGMYRVDSIMGAFLAFGLDNTKHDWNPFRYIPVSTGATWRSETRKWYRPSDVRAWVRRNRRQRKGKLENSVVKFFLTRKKSRPQDLPRTMRHMFVTWDAAQETNASNLTVSFSRHRCAANQILEYVEPDPAALQAVELGLKDFKR